MAKDKARYWRKQLDRAHKKERDWRKSAQAVLDRYADERDDDSNAHRFNILWANTETLRPNLVSATPVPECRQRYKKDDPVARVAAKILERALEFSLDQVDFEDFGIRIGNDYLLPGRAVARVEYLPTFEKQQERIPLTLTEVDGELLFKKPDGTPVSDYESDAEGPFVTAQSEALVFEEVREKRVPWKWFRLDPDADCWDNVNWVAFGGEYTREELLDEWGAKGAKVEFGPVEDDQRDHESQKAVVWEIWDKRSRKQLFIPEPGGECLEENSDPLKLENFFPMPAPVYAVVQNDTLVPTAEFVLWQDQADELDELTARLAKVTKAIKARGAYAGEAKDELTQILAADDNSLVPVEDWMAWAEKGGVEGLISWVPIEMFAKVLSILEQERQLKIQEVFQLTGVSDLQRGATDPRETAKAQMLKANFGTRRLLTKQQQIQRFFRDLFRIKAEIIAEQFDPQTLRLMVGLDNEDNELFNAAVELIQSDVKRAFNIDIETDSTIAIDEQKEKEGLAEAMTAIGNYTAAVFPMVQAGALPVEVAVELLRDYLRKFRFGRKLDDLLDDLKKKPPPPDPEAEKAKAEQEAQAKEQEQEMAMRQQELQAEMAQQQQEHELKMQELMAEIQFKQQEQAIKIEGLQAELAMQAQAHSQELSQDQQTHEQQISHQRESSQVQIDGQRQQAKADQQNRVQE